MALATLVGPNIEEGRRFIGMLAEAGIRVAAALWQWDGFLGGAKWELDLATPLVDEIGTTEAYGKVREVLSKAGDPPFLHLFDINLFSPKAWFIKDLRREFRGRRDLTLSKRMIGDHEVEHGYLYFVK